jgi:hypothetical protein
MTDKQKQIVRELRSAYVDVLCERIPDDIRAILAKLK